MRKVKTGYLKPGMKVARLVYNSNRQVLLNRGVILNEGYIKRLKELKIPALYIDDGLGLELAVDEIIADETRIKAIGSVKEMFNPKFSNVLAKNIIVPKAVLESVQHIITEVLNKSNTVINLADIRTSDDYTFAHSVNVCVLALVTGRALGYNHQKLYNLAVGAILHDIGKIRVPNEILNKSGKLTWEEFEIIKKHSDWGYEILQSKLDISIASRVAVYQHHERFNGEGYPQGLAGVQIHEFAQIIGLVDMYDAIVADRVYRPGFPAHEAFEMIAGSGDVLFRFEIVKAFLDYVAVYPAGTWVELNTGEQAVVIATQVGLSLRPQINFFLDQMAN